MENPEIAQILDEVADLLEIQGAKPFRIRAYRKAVQVINDLGERIADIVRDPNRSLEDYPGIGKDLAGKIQTIVETGDLPLRRELEGQVPAGLCTLLTVPNLGPKRASVLYKQLGITSLDELRAAAEEHRSSHLKGFGDKSEQAILDSVRGLKQSGKRILWSEAKVYAEALIRHLRNVPGIGNPTVAGRERATSSTLTPCSRPLPSTAAFWKSTRNRFGSTLTTY
ncbi:MAG: helix-hairpin-helix domain-containing protein [Planctomycetaceae bacterium]